jgi:phosphatidate phosphatase APP1
MASDWKSLLFGLGARLEHRWDRRRRAVRARLGWQGPITVFPYRGYGDHTRLRLKGRVLEGKKLAKPTADDSVWTTLVHMFHRFESDEIPGALVRAHFNGATLEAVADGEGYFEVEFSGVEGLDPDPPPDARWREVELELIEPLRDGQDEVLVKGQVLTPPAAAEFGVISDVDDTILKTGATDLLRNLRTTLLRTAEARSPFKGVGAFYRALERGRRETPVNPIFYVSSSPWNLYDLLERFVLHHGIPPGPFFLRDLGFDRTKLGQSRHQTHKIAVIERLFEFYPGLEFILIGDSGQHDAAIYREIVRRYQKRVRAVYIRNVTPEPGEVETLLGEVRKAGIEVALCRDLLLAAENAAAQGWIEPAAVEGVRAEVAAQSAAARTGPFARRVAPPDAGKRPEP